VPGKLYDKFRSLYPDSVYPSFPGIKKNNFGQSNGVWEKTAAFAFFLPGEQPSVLNQDVGVRIHGSSSRRWPRKSLRIYARGEYGASSLDHSFFPNLAQQEFDRIVLHNAGNDEYRCNMRDAVAQSIVRPMNILSIEYRPAMTFLNGEFYGINNIREIYGRHFFNRRFQIPQESFEAYKNGRLEAGDSGLSDMLAQYVANNSLISNEKFLVFASMLDPLSMTELFVSNIYLYNKDWLPNNTYLWRSKDIGILGDTIFRYAAIDMDKSMPVISDTVAASYNYLDDILNVSQNGQEPLAWFRAAMNNGAYRNDFITRFADVMNTFFLPERCLAIVSEFKSSFSNDFQEHIDRWQRPSSYENWEENVAYLDTFLVHRTEHQRNHIVEVFDLEGQMTVHLDVSHIDHGFIHINTIDINANTVGVPEVPAPWSGVYFKGLPITIEAIPYEGFMFSHWEGDTESEEASFSQVYDADSIRFKAFFIPDTLIPASIIHYWHFNDLDGVLETILPDSTILTGADLSYQGTGPGTIDRVEEGSQINAQLSVPAGSGLRVRNPSDNRELVLKVPTQGYSDVHFSYVTKRTTNGAETQNVEYRMNENGPWKDVGTHIAVLNFQLISYDLSDIEEVQDNESLSIRVRFSGPSATGNEGNNRFDNILISGRPIPFVDGPEGCNALAGTICIFPNPVRSRAHLSVGVKKTGVYTLEFYSSQGAKLETLYQGNILAELPMRFHHDVNSYPAGLYHYRLSSSSEVLTKKVVIE
jgi:hypothetical protein